MEIRHLRYFVAVAEELNFTRAAQKLHMTQPPLSKAVSELERQLGTRLLVRSSRLVRLTDSGRQLLPLAEEAVRKFDRIRIAMDAGYSMTKPLRIGFAADTGTDVLTDVAAALAQLQVGVDFTGSHTAELAPLLKETAMDVAIVRLPLDSSLLWLSAPLKKELGVVCAKDHPLASRRELELSELSEFPLITWSRPMAPGLFDDILATCRAHGLVPPHIKSGVRYTETATLEVLLADRASYLFAPLDWNAKTGFVWIPLVGRPLLWTTAVACPSGYEKRPAVQRAIETIWDSLRNRDAWSIL